MISLDVDPGKPYAAVILDLRQFTINMKGE